MTRAIKACEMEQEVRKIFCYTYMKVTCALRFDIIASRIGTLVARHELLYTFIKGTMLLNWNFRVKRLNSHCTAPEIPMEVIFLPPYLPGSRAERLSSVHVDESVARNAVIRRQRRTHKQCSKLVEILRTI